MFETFQTHTIQTSQAKVFLRTKGNGPTVLLLHGYPQTHACWHTVAPELAKRFFVVVPDLPGYGMSGKPTPDTGHMAHSKRTMAGILADVMAALGQDTFHVVGHDRGARVGYRMGLDHPDRVISFASLDVLPTVYMWDTWDKTRALGAFHWTLLAQPFPFPETFIQANPDHFHKSLMQNWAAPGFVFNPSAMNAYLEAMQGKEAIRSSCEDYRAGAGVDVEHDFADWEAGNKITCPLLFLWGAKRGFGGPQGAKDPLAIWQQWCSAEVIGSPLDCGHFLPEEAPQELTKELLAFLA